jgi:Zn-dependent M16 (insulinase) family peptidase
MDVYYNAIFDPLFDKNSFASEIWRYSISNELTLHGNML